MFDDIKKPERYNQFDDVDAIDMMERIWGVEFAMNFCKGNVFKYQMRLGRKDEVEKEKAKIAEYQRRYDLLKGKSLNL